MIVAFVFGLAAGMILGVVLGHLFDRGIGVAAAERKLARAQAVHDEMMRAGVRGWEEMSAARDVDAARADLARARVRASSP